MDYKYASATQREDISRSLVYLIHWKRNLRPRDIKLQSQLFLSQKSEAEVRQMVIRGHDKKKVVRHYLKNN
jgi:hypothetical protein